MGEDRLSTCQLRPPHSPDYFYQFTHVDMVWDKELGLVQQWQLFLPFVAFDDDLRGKPRGGLIMFMVPHTLIPRSNTNPTSMGRKAEVKPHFASPSQETNQKKDMRSDNQASCRWFFISHLCPRQTVKSVQNNELEHQVLWLRNSGHHWTETDSCPRACRRSEDKYFNITFRLTKPTGFVGLSYSSWCSFLPHSSLLPFSIPLSAQGELWIFPSKQFLEVPVKPLRHSFRKRAFRFHQSCSLC